MSAAPVLAGWPQGFPGDPKNAAICVDFDGTLAPMVADPALARPLDGATAMLVELAARYAVVAVISGRPASFLLELMGPDLVSESRLTLAGLYGLERFVPGKGICVPDSVQPWIEVIENAESQARKCAPQGIHIESKGLGFALHWRNASDHSAASNWAYEFALQSSRQAGLHFQHGRMSIELRPPVGGDKGTVVEQLCSGLGAACFIGDDLGDVPAFEALERLKVQGMNLAVKVGVRSSESPAGLLERADVVVDGPGQVLELLRSLP